MYLEFWSPALESLVGILLKSHENASEMKKKRRCGLQALESQDQ